VFPVLPASPELATHNAELTVNMLPPDWQHLVLCPTKAMSVAAFEEVLVLFLCFSFVQPRMLSDVFSQLLQGWIVKLTKQGKLETRTVTNKQAREARLTHSTAGGVVGTLLRLMSMYLDLAAPVLDGQLNPLFATNQDAVSSPVPPRTRLTMAPSAPTTHARRQHPQYTNCKHTHNTHTHTH
jgi:hypothetical protein